MFSALVALTLLAGCASTELPGVRNVHTVTPGVLIRGGQPDADSFAALHERYGIRTVVNLNDETQASEASHVESLGLAYVALPCEPHEIDPTAMRAFVRLMADPTLAKPVYVHCAQGMDRTGTAVGVYRVVLEDWPADRALDELESRRTLPHTLIYRDPPKLIRDAARDPAAWRPAASPTTP